MEKGEWRELDLTQIILSHARLLHQVKHNVKRLFKIVTARAPVVLVVNANQQLGSGKKNQVRAALSSW